MASVQRDVSIHAPAASVWDALRDVGALHTRLVPGFVTDCRLDGDTRTVTFGDGTVVHERIIAIDDAQRRVVWSVRDAPFVHHNGAAQVTEDGADRCRVTWTADLLPDTLAERTAAMMEQGLDAMRRALEKRAP